MNNITKFLETLSLVLLLCLMLCGIATGGKMVLGMYILFIFNIISFLAWLVFGNMSKFFK